MATVDSLLHIVASKDSLIAIMATRPITVAAERDKFDWLQLGASLVVAPGIALIATWYGGKRASADAMALHRQAIADDKVARAEERAESLKESRRERDDERTARRDQMMERITRTLSRVIELGKGIDDTTSVLAFSTRGAEMRILWEAFERQSSDLYLVGTPELRAEIAAFMASLHAAVAGTEAAREERNAMRSAEMLGSQMSGRSPTNILTQYDPAKLLVRFGETLVKNAQEAERLLGLLLQ